MSPLRDLDIALKLAAKSLRKPVWRNCEWCDEPYFSTATHGTFLRFCSHGCSDEYQRDLEQNLEDRDKED